MNMGCVVTTGKFDKWKVEDEGVVEPRILWQTSDQQSPKVRGSDGAGLIQILAFRRQPCDPGASLVSIQGQGRAASLALIGSKGSQEVA